MNSEEAIAQLEDLREHCKEYIKEDEEGFGVWSDDVEALNIAIDALRKQEKSYFAGTDVAKALGYSNPRDAIARHCKGVVKHDGATAND
jgi:prophage antirepressor|nr:MAG TPA: antirepressor [Caudoviricetes sp.]